MRKTIKQVNTQEVINKSKGASVPWSFISIELEIRVAIDNGNRYGAARLMEELEDYCLNYGFDMSQVQEEADKIEFLCIEEIG